MVKKEDNKRVILSIIGELDLYCAPELKDEIEHLVAEKKVNVVLNCRKVPYMDSSGVGVLIKASTLLKQHKGYLRVCELTERVIKLFDTTQVNAILSIYETEEEALA